MPDTTEVVKDVVGQAAPIIDKALDRQHEYNASLITLENVVEVNAIEAKSLLEEVGFRVSLLRVNVDKKYADKYEDTVVKMDPKPGKYQRGTLVKLYYLDEDIKLSIHKQLKAEKEKQEELQKEVGKHLDNFGKEVGKNVDNLAKFIANPFGKK